MRKKLSTSIYTFRTIIDLGCMYVDKTREIFDLASRPEGQFFLSRPRRFGKSLTLSTLESVFLGEKELFKGLYIYDQPYDWKKYPIIRLALNKMSSETAAELEEKLSWSLNRMAKSSGITLTASTAASKFQELIEELASENNKVVVLIDEYDKPILDNILNTEEVLKIRTLLKKFYGIIKACEEDLRFTFITGVSKFTQVSIFSDLNNLDDLSMRPEFATICGFTQEECEKYFAEWIEENAVKNEMSKELYLARLKELYDGIRFSEKDISVYNPVSFTKAMDQGNFKHHWFETGTPTFLLKLLKENDYDIVDFESLALKPSAFTSYEIDNLKLESLLYQTGYLTIKNYDATSELYTLSYPNNEVRQSFIERLTDYFTPVAMERVPALIEDLRKALLANDIDEVMLILNVFYAKIDYSIRLKHEKYYQSIFYILFTLLGYRISVEENTSRGRMDAVVKTDTHIYIFEFKLNKTAQEAIDQIQARDYYQKYSKDSRQLVLIGICFDSDTGSIKEHLVANPG